jgi:SAM-dependent methyltransferase
VSSRSARPAAELWADGTAAATDQAKQRVHDFWNGDSCGEALLGGRRDRAAYQRQLEERYRLEPFIPAFAEFERFRGARVLEIGVGLGADHERFAAAEAELYGIDLTQRAIDHTRVRLELAGLRSVLQVADAEALPFPDGHFDLVWSWGVLHHSPNPGRAIDEVWRVLRPGGMAKLMVYHSASVVGFMLWLRYGLLAGRPWRARAELYAKYLESPGTQAFTIEQARALCSRFERTEISIELTHADLLTSNAGRRHEGVLLEVARRLWPRQLIRRHFADKGLFMLIAAMKAPA